DHRGPAFEALTGELLAALAPVFNCHGPIIIFPSSGTGAWEAALVNTCAPGDRVLMAETGHFATQWLRLAERLGLVVDFLPGDWRSPADPDAIAARLADDREHAIRAVAVVHNETSTGVVSDVAAVRRAIDAADHPALLLVDTISSLASLPYDHDGWGVDVTVGASQKGLMLPPGLGFNAVGERALDAALTRAGVARGYWDWQPIIEANRQGRFPYTPATNLLFGLREALAMLAEEGLDEVFARHARHAAATGAAVAAWGLETVCRDPAYASASLTAVMLPEGHDADAFREGVERRYAMALGNGLGRFAGRVFRIGHLGDFDDLMLAATLSGVELGLDAAAVPRAGSGVAAALAVLGGRSA
ncbi:MAG: aminotransferase class V-fold PLP-dependent enzyme, partial [Gammaproteobacteria bacterium]|nr:aminotransferase class V-fold PLP-dependent enzyme [Gammaproteobacteria bacterium]